MRHLSYIHREGMKSLFYGDNHGAGSKDRRKLRKVVSDLILGQGVGNASRAAFHRYREQTKKDIGWISPMAEMGIN